MQYRRELHVDTCLAEILNFPVWLGLTAVGLTSAIESDHWGHAAARGCQALH